MAGETHSDFKGMYAVSTYCLKAFEKVTFSKKFYYGSVRMTENFFERVSWQETFSEVSISVTLCHYVLD